MGPPLLAVLVTSVLLAGVARRYDVSAPLALVLAGLLAGLIPGLHGIELEPELVLFVILPPLLWSAGLESSYVNLRRNRRRIGMLAVGLPLATTFAVGVVAYHTVPELTVVAALTLGAIVAPPDAVSAAAIGRRLGLPRQIMTLLGGESLLNDATALTAYKVSLAAAIGTAASWGSGLGTFALAAAGGVLVGGLMGSLIVALRAWFEDPLVESAIGLVAPFFIYLLAEEVHGSGVIAVVVAALIIGQRSTRASYATRLQDNAVWRAAQFVLESFAFLLIGLQLPTVVAELKGISAAVLAIASVSVLATVIAVRIVWVYVFAYLPRTLSARIRANEPKPTPAQVFIVAWAGMRGVVSLAAAFAVPSHDRVGRRVPGTPTTGLPDVRGGHRNPAVARADAALADQGARRAERGCAAGRHGAGRRPDQGGQGGLRPARRVAGRGPRADRRAPARGNDPARLELAKAERRLGGTARPQRRRDR